MSKNNLHLQRLLRAWARLTFSSKARARLYRKIAALINNGIKLLDAIDALYARSAKHGETETMTIILADIRLALRRGDSLSKALMQWVAPLECMTIAAGEESGNLGEMLELAAESLGGVREMKSAVIKGITYPAVLFVAIVATLYYLGVAILPDMLSVVDIKQLTGVAASLHWFTNFVQTIWFWIVIGGITAFTVTIYKTLPHAFGEDRFRVYLDCIPPWSLYRLVNASGFLVALSTLLKAGVQLQDAIIQIRVYSTPYLRVRLNAILLEIRKGRSFGNALDNAQYQFPTPEIIDDLIIYSTLPQFDEVLYEYGKEWMKEGIEAVKEQSLVLNGFAVFLMLMIVAWLAMGVTQLEQQMGAAVQQFN